MKFLKRLFVLMFTLSIFVTATLPTTVSANSNIRQGTVRVVVGNTEIDPLADELVYNGKRYINSDFFVFFISLGMEREICTASYNEYNKSVTAEFINGGYVSLFGNTNKIRILNNDFYTTNKLLWKDNRVYIAAEDIADFLYLDYGFDASKNTIYFY